MKLITFLEKLVDIDYVMISQANDAICIETPILSYKKIEKRFEELCKKIKTE